MAQKNKTRSAIKKALAFIMSASLCIGFIPQAATVSAEDETDLLPSRTVAVSSKAAKAPTIDGDLAEWGELRYSVNQQTEATIYNNICKFDSKWTNDTLILAVDVVDSDIVKDFTSNNIYENDSVEIFIDADHSKGDAYDNKNDYHLYIQHDGKLLVQGGTKGTLEETSIKDLAYVVKEDEDGFNVEVSIPFASLGIEPAEATLIGLEVSNNDNDSHTGIVRHTWLWNKDMNYAKPSTWGILYLATKKAPVIVNSGTPSLDKPNLAEWDLSNVQNFNAYTGATTSFGAMSDNENLYIGLLVSDPTGIFDTIQTKEVDGVTEEFPPHIQFVIDGDNTGSGPRNQYDVILQWAPLAKSVQFHYASGSEKKTCKGTQFDVDNGYFLICIIPWNNVTPLVEGTDFAARENYSFLGFDIMSGRTDNGGGYYSGGWVPMWGDQACDKLGKMFVNNADISAHVNRAPKGNDFWSYSVAQGTTVQGAIKVTDADDDPITYKIVKDIPKSEGTVTLDEKTGEWTYTPPSDDFIKPAYKVDDPLYYGYGKDPTGVNFLVEASDGLGGVHQTRVEIKVLHAPTNKTYYVDGDNGKDTNSGLTKDKPLKTIMAAHDKTNPGDTVIIFESETPYGWSTTYTNDGPFVITRSGLPEAYITYKAAPGENPVLMSNGEWNTMILQACYIIMDGLTFQGQADQFTYEEAFEMYYGKETGTDTEWGKKVSQFNTNGLCINPTAGRKASELDGGVLNFAAIVTHHVTVRNCTANLTGSGIGTSLSDYITVENCVATNTGWWCMYASSGFGSLGNIDIDDNTEDYKIIFRNNIAIGNRHFLPWVGRDALSDGNGIIIDSNNNAITDQPYEGKILVTNNLVYENGGSGIHTFRSDNTYIINNTILYNNATPFLNWGEMFNNQSNYVGMYNNIVYSRTGCVENPTGSGFKGIEYDNNIFYNYNSSSNVGKAISGVMVGSNNLYPVDPQFEDLAPAVHDVTKATYPSTWSAAAIDNAKKAGYVPGDNYDVTTNGTYNTALKATSPAFGAGNEEWSKIVGNDENIIGVFDTVGPVREDYELPEDPEITDETTAKTDKPSTSAKDENPSDSASSDKTENDDSDSSSTDILEPSSDSSSMTAPIILVCVAAVIAAGAAVGVALKKKKK